MIHKSFDAKYLAYLARFIRKRDKEAFVELYNYTHKKIDQYALQFLKDPHSAQDAVQEIYSHLQEYRFSKKIHSFCHG